MNDVNTETSIIPAPQTVMAEMATTQTAELARATTEAQYLVALKRPRNEDVALQRMLRECKRPSFSDVAVYSIPIAGQRIEGLTIRFAEAAARVWGNLSVTQTITYDDGKKRIVRVMVVDLESNATMTGEVVVELVVRRRSPGDREVLGVQRNSKGEQSYLVACDERDASMLTASAVSKLLRTLVLRLIPGWVLDECRAQLDATAQDKAAQDPDGQRRAMVAAFGDLNVPADQLAEYLGHDLATATPAEVVQLKRVYVGIRDAGAIWSDQLAQRVSERSGVKPAEPSNPGATTKDKLKDAARKAREAKGQPAATDGSDAKEPPAGVNPAG